ncbi:MAG: FkbM family methyltransferase [Kiritimatiellia bacterium]
MTDYLPLADNSVDFILFAHVIEHLYHPIQILRELVRVLKPGGKILLTTDHGMLLGGLLNYLNNGSYLHEPVETTAAMVFDEWRGHVRFYTAADLKTLLEAAGARVLECRHYEVLYNSVPEEYFVEPFVKIPRWRAQLLTEFPPLRNEVMILAEKGPHSSLRIENPLDATANASELADLARDFNSMQCNLERATLLDLALGSRLLLGRWPTPAEIRRFRENPPRRGVDDLVRLWLESPEFAARGLGVQLERPGPSCIIMTETAEGLRFFFSAQDTFVGFPIAVGVFEPDVRAAIDRLIQPGMNCIDVGANIGYHTLRMAAVVSRDGGRVFSFEPDPFSFSLLLKNLKENRLEHAVVPFQYACGDEDGEVDLFRDLNPSNFGGAHTRKPGQWSPSVESIAKVPMRRLDGVLPDHVGFHLVKVDVEGFEPFVLKGMHELIRRNLPVIVCEFNVPALQQFGSDVPERFLQNLMHYGYQVYEAASFGRGEETPFVYPREGLLFANLVCIPGRRP